MATLRSNGRHAPRLALTMVVRDCAATLAPLLKTIRPYVDEIIIALGGESRDGTEKIARKYGDVVFPIEWTWDWASARNQTLKHVTSPYFMWLDGDDQIENPEGLSAILDAMDKGIDRVDLRYDYAFDEQGNVLTAHHRERILRTSKEWHWLDRVHETCNTDQPHKAAYDESVTVTHKRDGSLNSSERNLPILLEMMEADPKPRTLIHLAHAYFSLAKWAEAIFYYEQYCDAPENDLNQWSAQVMASRCAVETEGWQKTMVWAMSAAALLPQYQDPYILLAAASWHTEHDPEKAEAWLRQAKQCAEAPLQIFRMPLDNQVLTWDIEHRIYAVRKQWSEALAICEHAYTVTKNKEQWLGLCQFYRECVLTERSRASALQLADHMIRHGDVTRAKTLLESFLPSTVRDDPAVLSAKYRVYQMLDSNHQEDYEEADEFWDDWDIEEFPRFHWYVQRLRAIGAKKVLEVGCHIGLISRALAKLGFECVGVDFNQKVIDIANQKSEGLSARFVCGRLEDITEQFDAVLCAEILEHLPPAAQIQMLNYAETLAPVVLGSVPAEPIGLCAGLWEDSEIGGETFRPHIFEFDQNDLEQLILTDPARKIVNCHKLTHKDHPIPGYANRVFEYTRDPKEKQGVGISFLLGPGHEQWTPLDIEGKGVGGSETAAVRIAQDLASRGHYVTVYGPDEGVYDGVVYRNWRKFDPDEAREVVIVSRDFTLTETRPNAAIVALWCHDIAYDEFPPEIAERFDRIVVMSQWQRDFWIDRYPWLDEDKIVAIGNGLTIYPTESERIRGRFIYSSSPDRGLDDLLERWPLIQEAFPDGEGGSLAELHVFYGWQYLDTVPQLKPFKHKVLQLAKQDGVFMHGRIGQKELAEEFAKAQFWLYPSILPNDQDFHETFCISALEAQAYGTIPITRKVGALAERYGDEAFLEVWNTGSIMQRIEHWDSMKHTPLIQVRANWRENAEATTWHSVADKWLALIGGQIVEKYGELVEA